MDFTPRVPPGFGGSSDLRTISQYNQATTVTAASASVTNGAYEGVAFANPVGGGQMLFLPETGFLHLYGTCTVSGGAKVTGYEDCFEVIVVDAGDGSGGGNPDPGTVSPVAVAWFWGTSLEWNNQVYSIGHLPLLTITGVPRLFAVYVRSGIPVGSGLTAAIRLYAVVETAAKAHSASSWIHPKASVPPFQTSPTDEGPSFFLSDAADNAFPQAQTIDCVRHFQSDPVAMTLSDDEGAEYWLPIFGGPWQMRMTGVSMESTPDTLTGSIVDMSARTWDSATAVYPYLDSQSASSFAVSTPNSALVNNPWGLVATDGGGNTTANVQITCSYGG